MSRQIKHVQGRVTPAGVTPPAQQRERSVQTKGAMEANNTALCSTTARATDSLLTGVNQLMDG